MSKIPSLTWTLDGVRYTMHPGLVTGEDARLYRAETKAALPIMNVEADQISIDTLAAMIWVARRQAGERQLKYVDVERVVTLEKLSTIEFSTDDDADDEGVEDPNA
jgi:hypothetical protein